MYRHILIPTDGSELSKKAIQHGVGLAKALGALLEKLLITAKGRYFTAGLTELSRVNSVLAKLDMCRSADSLGKPCIALAKQDWRGRLSALLLFAFFQFIKCKI